MTKRILAVSAAALISLAAVGGCGSDSKTQSTSSGGSTSSAASQPAKPKTKAWDRVAVGQCIAEKVPEGDISDKIKTVDCAQPHYYEIFAKPKTSSTNTSGPGSADDVCEKAFESYVGKSYKDTDYDFSTITESDKPQSDGEVICILHDENEQEISGSAKKQ